MARTLSSAMAAYLESQDSLTLASMLRLDMRDGTSLGITDHDVEIPFDLGDGSLTYSASTGILPSDVVLAAGMDSSNFEASGPIGDVVTRAALLGGRFTAAKARFFLVNWQDLTMGPIRIMSGRVSSPKIVGAKFTFEILSAGDAFNQVIGRVLSPYCTYDFGDAKCTVTNTAFPATVTAVTSAFQFTTNLGGTYADNFFDVGSIQFLTGALAGSDPLEIFKYTGASGALELYVPAAQAPQVGDTLNVFRGCSKLRSSAGFYSATVISATDTSHFVCNLAGQYADSFFDGGPVTWISGQNVGTPDIGVSAYVGSTGAVTLASALTYVPTPGDVLQFELAGASLPTCLSYGNVVNFGGHPDVPGTRAYLKTSVAGMAGA